MSAPRIDAHHHLWRYTPEEFGWIDEPMAAIRRDFTADNLDSAMAGAHVEAAVAVQARQSIAETEFLLATAETTPQIAGVVGWLPIAAPDFGDHVERWQRHPHLKGLRHVVQAEHAGFLDDKVFNEGIRQLAGSGLVYDILIHAGQLQEATRFVDQHPAQVFVLDHVAKPRIAAGEREPWSTDLKELARRANVTCKISGMVTEADLTAWSPAQLQPYFDVALEAFGPDRLLAGSDWPVLTAGCTYSRWWSILEDWIAPLSVSEQAAILGGNANRIYQLNLTRKQAA